LLNIIILQFIHVIARVSISLLIIAEWYSIICVYLNLFLHSPADINLSGSYFEAIKNKADLNICLQDFMWTHAFISFGKGYRNGMAIL
jgi:hypothetical protein